jgi:integrase/recombinase XerD
MTQLRTKMIEAMQLRGFSPRTHSSYLYTVQALARYYHRSPDQLDVDDVQAFLQYLAVNKQLSPSTCRLHLHGIRFLFVQVLGREAFKCEYHVPKYKQRIPELLTHSDVKLLIATLRNLKHRMLLMTCYGCGLRLSELTHLKVRHIDGERKLLRVEQGKGAKDRLVPISPLLLVHLRRYWKIEHPKTWLFPGRDSTRPLCVTSPQKAYQQARQRAGITKVGGIHALRHAYATHQLEAGLPVHHLQRYLGHRNIQSTLRYVHWVPTGHGRNRPADLLVDMEVAHV